MRLRFASLAALLPLVLGCATNATTSTDQPAGADAKPIEAAFVSASGGEPGGLVIFWPRVIPRSDDPEVSALAGQVQAKLVELAQATYPDRPIDVRPEPERVCPREGCPAATLGVLLLHDQAGQCAAVALSSPGQTAASELAVWAGNIVLQQAQVEFREHPENHVGIRDYVPCEELLASMAAKDEDVVAGLRATIE
jgi:hypothetical protein